jgi:hypothetical protein
MDNEPMTTPGIVIPVSALAISRARWFANVLGGGGLDYVKIIEAVRNDANLESIIFDVEVELPQKTEYILRMAEKPVLSGGGFEGLKAKR